MMKSRLMTGARAGRLSALAAALLLLGGCMNLIPRYERPAAPVAPGGNSCSSSCA